MTAERLRLEAAARKEEHWRRWGPYLSERSWGTVREDYSADGNAWSYLTHDQARSKAYRWGEDGIAGFCDNHQQLCLAFAFWNGQDPYLKERLFGLSGPEGNHGEDVKELHYYLDATPTYSYAKCLYKYPQARFPYEDLMAENRRRDKTQREYELIDTGVFDQDKYWDIFVEYAKGSPNDILTRVTVVNRGPEPARLHLLPTLWFRNTWSWKSGGARPVLSGVTPELVEAVHPKLGRFTWRLEPGCELLFTDNETNTERLYGRRNEGYCKDGMHEYLVNGRRDRVRTLASGTKAAACYQMVLDPGQSRSLRLRLTNAAEIADFDKVLAQRAGEADEFYGFQRAGLSEDARQVQRQALAGLLWSRQWYHYVVEDWLNGDEAGPAPPPERRKNRNGAWAHVFSDDVLTMPDKWEYPWFAAWDTAFHMIPLSLVDPDSAKRELGIFLREWYMHPNGQIPAYEWNFSDVNPPVHAWACWRVYKIDAKLQGRRDIDFLESAFHKLLMNFTWWVNRKDSTGDNIFEGGFLGLDNIGVFDRSAPLPTGGFIEQSDGTSWMAMYCLNMLRIALELALEKPIYEDIASKFLEHFLYIASAMNGRGEGLWDEQDGFYYDRLRMPQGGPVPLKVRSMVGLIPLFAVETFEESAFLQLEGFRKRARWFLENRPDLCGNTASLTHRGVNGRGLLALCSPDRLRRILQRMLDETEFLSPYGVRSLSRYHLGQPYVFRTDGSEHRVDYEPAESTSRMFGGNSNWRGPVWFPANYLLIESLQKFGYYYGDTFLVDFPTGSGRQMTLGEVAGELSRRLTHLFLLDGQGRRPVFGGAAKLQADKNFRDHVLFYEYFHGDNGAGIGASHQTGWTALVAKLIQQSGE